MKKASGLYDGNWVKEEETPAPTARMTRMIVYTGTPEFIERMKDIRAVREGGSMVIYDGRIEEIFMRYENFQQDPEIKSWWYLPIAILAITAIWWVS